jgi:hypothetical protein
VCPRAGMDAVAKRKKNPFIASGANRTPVIQSGSLDTILTVVPRLLLSTIVPSTSGAPK